MTDDPNVSDALASISDDYEIRGTLHAVPPHAVYEVTVDGRPAVCKVARGPGADPATEARVMAFVARKTSVPVPEVLAVGDDWFVAEWRHGLPDDPTVDVERARTLGAGLATLHAETEGQFERTGFPRAHDEGGGEGERDSEGGVLAVDARDSWAETVTDLLVDCRDYLADVGYAEVAEVARSFVSDHPDVFDGAGAPVLAHGNYLPDHVGLREGEVACVVDWEHTLVAPAEYDYLRTVTPLFGGGGGTDDPERQAFREGYESVRSLPGGFEVRADAYRLVDAVSYLKALHVQRQKHGQEKARAAVAFRQYVLDAVEERRAEDRR